MQGVRAAREQALSNLDEPKAFRLAPPRRSKPSKWVEPDKHVERLAAAPTRAHIIDALYVLRQNSGVTRPTLFKYLQSAYTKNNEPVVRRTLKTLVEQGIVEQLSPVRFNLSASGMRLYKSLETSIAEFDRSYSRITSGGAKAKSQSKGKSSSVERKKDAKSKAKSSEKKTSKAKSPRSPSRKTENKAETEHEVEQPSATPSVTETSAEDTQQTPVETAAEGVEAEQYVAEQMTDESDMRSVADEPQQDENQQAAEAEHHSSTPAEEVAEQ